MRNPFRRRRWVVTLIDGDGNTLGIRTDGPRDELTALAYAFSIAAEHDLDIVNFATPVWY